MADPQNFSSYEGIASSTGITHIEIPLVTSTACGQFVLDPPGSIWTVQWALLVALSLLLLPKTLSSIGLLISKDAKDSCKRATPVPYLIPIVGNLCMFLYDPQELIRLIA